MKTDCKVNHFQAKKITNKGSQNFKIISFEANHCVTEKHLMFSVSQLIRSQGIFVFIHKMKMLSIQVKTCLAIGLNHSTLVAK